MRYSDDAPSRLEAAREDHDHPPKKPDWESIMRLAKELDPWAVQERTDDVK